VQTLIEEGFSPEEPNRENSKSKGWRRLQQQPANKGRCGLYEVMEVDDEIRELVLVGASAWN